GDAGGELKARLVARREAESNKARLVGPGGRRLRHVARGGAASEEAAALLFVAQLRRAQLLEQLLRLGAQARHRWRPARHHHAEQAEAESQRRSTFAHAELGLDEAV